MKKICTMLMCACLMLTGCAANAGYTGKDEAELNRLIPDEAPTHEDMVRGALDLCAAAQDSYARMTEAASRDGADEKGVQEAEKVRETYGKRLTELAKLDYDAMRNEEIIQYMEEVSNIITAIREVRDIFNGLGIA